METLEGLTRRAAAGDAGAQYQLAASLSRSGRRDEAEHWLQSSARLGHADALYTLATRRLGSFDAIGDAAEQLSAAAQKGSKAAVRQLAVLSAMGLGVDRDDSAAISPVINLARDGDPAAQSEIACLLALGDRDQPDIDALAAQAAPHDVAAAALLLARAPRSPVAKHAVDDAITALRRVRHPRTEQLSAAAQRSDETVARVDWTRVSKVATLSPLRSAKPEQLCDAPDIAIWRNAVDQEVCEYAIARSRPRLGPSLVYDPQRAGMMRDPLRTSQSASLSPIDLDLALVALNRLVSQAAGCAEENGEFLSILHYAPGQQYRPHFDCIPEGPDFERSGQRIKTALLFLNDDYEGGATHFLAPDLKVKGRQGDLLIFSNVKPDGSPDLDSRHAGLPVENGEKWLASKWFRSKKFRF